MKFANKLTKDLCKKMNLSILGNGYHSVSSLDVHQGYCLTNERGCQDAWDSICCMNFSEPYGYMDTGYDFDDTILKSGRALDYFSHVGQMPFLDSLLLKNPIIAIGPGSPSAVNDMCFRRLQERISGRKQGRKPDVQDFLGSFSMLSMRTQRLWT